MFHLIPAPLHRAALRLAHALRRTWWRVARRPVNGCRVLAFDEAGRVLLIRHSYGSGDWMLPSGGLRRGEDPVAAARRELAEETGCALAGAILIGVHEEPLHGTVNHVHLVAGRARGEPREDNREVIACGFFAAGRLPTPRAPGLDSQQADWAALARRVAAAQNGSAA